MMTLDPNLRAYAMLTFTTCCWGLNAIFSRMAVGEVSPLQLVTFRWLGVVILLLVFARKHLVRDWPVLRQHLLYLFLMGSLGFTAFNGLFYVAGHSTSAINIGILQGSIPVFVLLGGFFIFGHRITRLQTGGATITLLGVVIITAGGNFGELKSLTVNQGDLLMLIACFFYAAYSLGLSRRPQASAPGLFFALAIVAWLTSLPLVAFETNQQGWQAPSTTGWVIVLLVTVLPSLIAQIFFIQGVDLIGPDRAGVFVNLIPVFASIMAVVFLHESFKLFHANSLSLVLGGIWLSEIGKVKH